MSRLEELLADAELALDTAKNGRSLVFRKSAAEWLRQIAGEMESLLRSEAGETECRTVEELGNALNAGGVQ